MYNLFASFALTTYFKVQSHTYIHITMYTSLLPSQQKSQLYTQLIHTKQYLKLIHIYIMFYHLCVTYIERNVYYCLCCTSSRFMLYVPYMCTTMWLCDVYCMYTRIQSPQFLFSRAFGWLNLKSFEKDCDTLYQISFEKNIFLLFYMQNRLWKIIPQPSKLMTTLKGIFFGLQKQLIENFVKLNFDYQFNVKSTIPWNNVYKTFQ